MKKTIVAICTLFVFATASGNSIFDGIDLSQDQSWVAYMAAIRMSDAYIERNPVSEISISYTKKLLKSISDGRPVPSNPYHGQKMILDSLQEQYTDDLLELGLSSEFVVSAAITASHHVVSYTNGIGQGTLEALKKYQNTGSPW